MPLTAYQQNVFINCPFDEPFLGAKPFGGPKQKRKNCLILDREKYQDPGEIRDLPDRSPRHVR